MIRTEARDEREKEVHIFPTPSRDVNLKTVEIPSTARERARLRKQLEKDILASTQEQRVLGQFEEASKIPTAVGKVTEIITGRARAMNPIRDFDKVGFSWFNNGVNPWKDSKFVAEDAPPAMMFYGLVAGFLSAVIVSSATHSFAITAGAVGFAMAPLFISMWAGRTIFNLAAGVLAGAAAPAAYAAGRILDLVRQPGHLRAKEFLSDLETSLIPPEERGEVKKQRVSMLSEVVAKQQTALRDIEAADHGKYRVKNGDRSRIDERYLDPDRFAGMR